MVSDYKLVIRRLTPDAYFDWSGTDRTRRNFADASEESGQRALLVYVVTLLRLNSPSPPPKQEIASVILTVDEFGNLILNLADFYLVPQMITLAKVLELLTQVGGIAAEVKNEVRARAHQLIRLGEGLRPDVAYYCFASDSGERDTLVQALQSPNMRHLLDIALQDYRDHLDKFHSVQAKL